MTDLLHYFLEEDMRYTSAEEAESVSGYRSQLYLLYGKTYRYGKSSGSQGGRAYVPKNSSDNFNFDDPIMASTETKPYVPPTDFNPDSAMPFGSVLDAPIG